MLFFIGIISGLLAYWVGKWRHSCIFWMKEEPANCPLGWQNPIWQLGSWLIVTILSLVFATCLALLISNHVNELIGMLSWGALLVLRWVVSGIGVRMEDQKRLEQMNVRISSIGKEQNDRGSPVQRKRPKGSSPKEVKDDLRGKSICRYCEGWGEVRQGKKGTSTTCPHCSGTGWSKD